jgi:DamX protein
MRRSTSQRKSISRKQLDPFGSDPDKRFYYAFEAFEQRLAILRRLIQGSDALILVVGEKGSGKTTLLQRVLDTTDRHWKPCRVQTAASEAVGRLSRLKQKSKPAAFLLKDPSGTIVLMDDAHGLSRKELRKLIQDTLTPDPDRKIKRMVLFGEPRVSETLDIVSDGLVDETAINKIFLPTITEQEAALFIRHRLAVAGFNGKNPFTPANLKNLYEGSAGLPGRINESAARLWTKKGYSGSTSRSRSNPGQRRLLRVAVWSTTVVAAALVAGTVWMYSDSDPRINSAASAEQQVIRVKIHSGTGQPSPRADIASGSPPAKPNPARLKPARPALSSKAQKPLAPETSRSVSAPATVKTSKPPASGRATNMRRETWLLAQNPANYTIQLLGVRNEQSLLAFVADHRLDSTGQAAYYRSRFKGGIWFPLVYGTYPTVDAARGAIAGLPQKIRKTSPWIRKMSAVHAEIRKAAKP